jgi:hypothetical protein
LPLLDVVKPIMLANNRWRCDHGWDIDLDDGSSNYIITNNLCLRGGIKNREGFRARREKTYPGEQQLSSARLVCRMRRCVPAQHRLDRLSTRAHASPPWGQGNGFQPDAPTSIRSRTHRHFDCSN